MSETAPANDFMQLSKDIAKKFLHTVVFVDEQAYFEKTEQPTQTEKPTRMNKPQNTMADIGIPAEQAHYLNAKEVMDTFASEGMVCTVLRPTVEDPLKIVIEAAKRADAIILDWDIHNDNGDRALQIIQKIIEEDLELGFRLRLILIYSGEPNIVSISEKVAECLDLEEDHLTFTRGHLRIGIFSKENTGVIDVYKDRVISIRNLPDLLAKEMAEITAGILSNVALESISVLRDNTHMILGIFGTELDPAYLSHRALLPSPDDAMEHAVDLVVSEYQSVLENREVGKIASFEVISKCLREKIDDTREIMIKFDNNSANLKYPDLVDIQEHGLLKSTWLDRYVKDKHPGLAPEKIPKKKENIYVKKAYRTLTQVFALEGEDAGVSDNLYATVSSFKKRNGSFLKNPILTQGTILKEEGMEPGKRVDSYYLCIQPRCDCVRIDCERNFLFLPLRVKEDSSKFDFVIELEKGNFVRLQIINTPYEIISYRFQVNDNPEGLIQAVIENEEYYFYSNGIKFRWIAELKNEQSQKVVNNFAAKISRVGTNDYEWLRRSQSGA